MTASLPLTAADDLTPKSFQAQIHLRKIPLLADLSDEELVPIKQE